MKLKILFILTLLLPIAYAELINVNVKIHPASKEVQQGDEVFAEVSLVNIALNKDDITIKYYITDKNGNIINMESETVLMTTRMGRVRSLELPNDLSIGKYSFVVEVIYKEKNIGKASDMFEVIPAIIEAPAMIKDNALSYAIIIILFLFILFIIYDYIKFKQIENLIKKINEGNLRRKDLIN